MDHRGRWSRDILAHPPRSVWCGPAPHPPGALLAHRASALLVKSSPSRRWFHPSPLPASPGGGPRAAGSGAGPGFCRAGEGHLVNVPRRGAEVPTSPPSLPGTAPTEYPEALQQLLTGPEADLPGGPAVGPGYRNKQNPKLPVGWRHWECSGSLHPPFYRD